MAPVDEPNVDDAALLQKAQQGDRQALERLISAAESKVYRFGMKMCRSPDDAADVLQETLLSLVRGLREFRGASTLSTWLYAVARSHCAKKRRRSKFAPAGVASLESEVPSEAERLAAPVADPEEQVAKRQLDAAVAAAIGTLPEDAREVLTLRDVEGLSAAEVAEIVGISVAAVKSRLHRARLAVREQLAPLLQEAPAAAFAPGAQCPDVLLMFSQNLEGEITRDTCARMQQHVDGCRRCRAACDSLKQSLAVCRAAPGASVPAEVQRSVRAAVQAVLASETRDELGSPASRLP